MFNLDHTKFSLLTSHLKLLKDWLFLFFVSKRFVFEILFNVTELKTKRLKQFKKSICFDG